MYLSGKFYAKKIKGLKILKLKMLKLSLSFIFLALKG